MHLRGHIESKDIELQVWMGRRSVTSAQLSLATLKSEQVKLCLLIELSNIPHGNDKSTKVLPRGLLCVAMHGLHQQQTWGHLSALWDRSNPLHFACNLTSVQKGLNHLRVLLSWLGGELKKMMQSRGWLCFKGVCDCGSGHKL